MPAVLLAGYAAYESVAEVPSLFADAGCRVEVFSADDSWLLKNAAWSTHHRHVRSDPARYARELEALVRRNRYDWVVLADDQAIRIVDDELGDRAVALGISPLSKRAGRPALGSKAGFSEACARYGIPTPAYFVHRGEGRDIGDAVRATGFPLLLKVDRSEGGTGITFCADRESAERAFANLGTDERRNLVFQSYVRGKTVGIEALYRHGRLLGYAYAEVTRTLNGEFGISSERRYAAHPDIEPHLSRLGDSFGIDGFASITCILDPAGTHHFVEADLRPHGWFVLARFAGVDFSMLVRAYVAGRRGRVLASRPGTEPSLIAYFYRDFVQKVRAGDIRGVLAWLCNKDGRWRFVPWRDGRTMRAYAAKAMVLAGRFAWKRTIGRLLG